MSCFRICMSIGVNQLLNAASYFILAYYMTEVHGVCLWSSRSTPLGSDDILASLWYPNCNHISNEDRKISQILDRPAKSSGKSAFFCHLWCCSSHNDGRNFEPPWYAWTSMLTVRNFNMWVLWSCDGVDHNWGHWLGGNCASCNCWDAQFLSCDTIFFSLAARLANCRVKAVTQRYSFHRLRWSVKHTTRTPRGCGFYLVKF